MSLDPYAPPLAPMKGLTPAEAADTGLKYTTFWSRVGAGLLDFLFVSPLLAMPFIFGDSQQYYLYSLLPIQLISLFYYVFLVTRYGATPGKLIVGMRIAMLDGSPITLKAACLRYGMWWILALISGLGSAIAAAAMTPEALAGGYLERSVAMAGSTPAWAMAAGYATQALLLGSIIAILVSKKRRTLHDFLAGTVVVRKK